MACRQQRVGIRGRRFRSGDSLRFACFQGSQQPHEGGSADFFLALRILRGVFRELRDATRAEWARAAERIGGIYHERRFTFADCAVHWRSCRGFPACRRGSLADNPSNRPPRKESSAVVSCERDPRGWRVGAEPIARSCFIPCRPHITRRGVAHTAIRRPKWPSRDDLFRVLRLASGYGICNWAHGAVKEPNIRTGESAMIKERQAHPSFALGMVLARLIVGVIAIASVCSTRQNAPLLQIDNSSGQLAGVLRH